MMKTVLGVSSLVTNAALLAGAAMLGAAGDASAADAPVVSVGAASNPKEVGARRVVTIDGKELHYQEMGDPKGETLVLLHGAGGIASTGQVGPLLAKRYRVLIPSLPGFDDTPRGDSRTLADGVEIIARFIAKESKGPVYVAGQSLGGRTASWLTITHPELVRKLVLSAPATFAQSTPELPQEDEAAKKFLAKILWGSEARAAEITAAELARQRAMMALLADYAKNPTRDTLLARVGEISIPTLILWGTKDVLLQPSEGVPLFADRIKDLRVQYLDGAHGLPVTNAREYAEYTQAFLDGIHPARLSGTPFLLLSSAFGDDGTMAKKHAGKRPGMPTCDGENVSPPLHWINAPAATRSFALISYDPTGRKGLGVTHWVAYGIAADRSSIAEGEGSSPTGFINGKNAAGTPTYLGPCPPFGDYSHHYMFTLIATDLPPEALAPGLTREELLAALADHALAATSLIGRYGH